MPQGEDREEIHLMTPPRRRRFTWLGIAGTVLGLALAAAIAAVLLLRERETPSSGAAPIDPRLMYAGPFRNIHPSVKYVSESQCADCHQKEAHSFADHPMGRSLLPIADAPAPKGSASEKNRFSHFGSWFEIDADGDQVKHRRMQLDANGRVVIEQTWDVHYVIGSGSRGHSYLTQADGFLFQTPISWYSQEQRWDVSPALSTHQMAGRTVLPGCLFCHSNRANHIDDTINGYTQPPFDGHSIGCQRCHGPGELHVAAAGAGAGGSDYSIINPKHLEPHLANAVCEQCHLHGKTRVLRHGRDEYDFRPGLPLREFWSMFVPTDGSDEKKAVGQVEQMYESVCFQKTTAPKRLGCVSCHDPHKRVPQGERIAFYRDRCMQCHQQRGCGLPKAERLRQSPSDSCMDCHMPRYGTKDIAHTASTDHRILKFGKLATPAARKRDVPPQLPIASFYPVPSGDAGEVDRDLALAVVELASAGDPAAKQALQRVLPKLDAAVARDPNDLKAAETKAYLLGMLGHFGEAMTLYDDVLRRAPDRESALAGASLIAESLGLWDSAIGYWRRAAARNPRAAVYRHSLTMLLAKAGEWKDALSECDAWLRLDAFNAQARSHRVMCLLALGDKNEARAEFARIEALAPSNMGELRARYEARLR